MINSGSVNLPVTKLKGKPKLITVYNPLRRNRNIGTSRQGHGQDNKLVIPHPCVSSLSFHERLGSYDKFERTINDQIFVFVIEKTREGVSHACSINDIVKILEFVPCADIKDLKLIVLRQPKRKEEILSPVWGRLIYSYEFERDYYPAIIMEAVECGKKMKWPVKLSLESQRELDRLKLDGHIIIQDTRFTIIHYTLENVCNTQLYRTLLHEIGHYVHYLRDVKRPGYEGEPFEAWELRNDLYFNKPQIEREQFANKYAEILRADIIEKQIIPFEKL